MNAAVQLITDNPRFGEPGGGAEAVYLRPKGAEPAQAVSAITMVGTASIAELLRMLSAVAERLTPAVDPDPSRPPIKLELWWVQDVHSNGLGIELPNRLILDEWWANDLFASAASEKAVAAAEEGKESRVWVGRVARMFEGNRGKGIDPRVVMQNDMEGVAVSREGQRTVLQTMARNDLGLLAQAARTAFVADVVVQKLASDPEFAKRSPERQGTKAEAVLDERTLSWVQPVDLEFPQTSELSERVRLWIAACRAAAAASQTAVRSVVIFDANATRLQGALLGEKKVASDLVPYAQLDRELEISLFDSDAPETGKVLRLYLPVSSLPPEADTVTPPSP